MKTPAQRRADANYYRRNRKAYIFQVRARRCGIKVTMAQARAAVSRGVFAS